MSTTFTQPTARAPKAPPVMRGWPVLGNALEMSKDPLQLLVRGYRELGPVFSFHVPGRTFTVIAGPAAFEFVAAGGEQFLSAAETLGAAASEAGARRTLVTVDIDEHAHMRKAQRPGYSKSAFLKGASAAFVRTEERLRMLQPGQVIDAFPMLQRLVMEQLALALIGAEANDYFDDVRTYIATILNVRVHGLRPELALRTPNFRKAKARFLEIGTRILQARRASGESRGDLIDDALAYRDLGGVPLDDRELVMAVMSPFIAGMDTAAAMASFLLYELLTSPEVREAVVREVDAHLDLQAFTPDMLAAMPALHGAAMQTLRMHTIALAQPRRAVRDFEVEGYGVREGEQVMMSGAVSHFLPEFYPDPYRFDPTRFSAPRNEHRKKHAYAPYGIGAHLCLGAGAAEVQFPLNVALLLKRFELALSPSDYKLRLSNSPTPHPDKFRVRIVARR